MLTIMHHVLGTLAGYTSVSNLLRLLQLQAAHAAPHRAGERSS
jgi:hypothetical protein